MGLFLGNLHVLTKTVDGRMQAIQALRTIFAESGYEETSDPEESQLDLTIVTSADLRWTSCLGEWHLDPSLLSQTCERLSKEADAPVLSVLIYDSDTMWLALYENDKRLDGFTTDPDQDSEDNGNPEKWQTLIDDALERKQLREIWDAPYIFVEEKLHPLATLINIPEPQFRASTDELDGFEPHQHTTLHFCKLSTSTAVEQICIETLGPGTGLAMERTSVGELLWKQHTFVNRGVGFTGFDLVLDGSAISDGVVSPWQMIAKYFTSSTQSALRIGHEQHAPEQVERRSDGSSIICKFKELKVTAPDDRADRFRVAITLILKGEKEGAGDVRIRMIPHEDSNAAVGFEHPVRVEASFRKPLKFTGDPTSAYYLRKMATQRYLLGVVIANEHEIWSDARAAFEQLMEVWSQDQSKTLTLSTKKVADTINRLPKVRKEKLELTDLVHSKKWKNLASNFGAYQLIIAEVDNRFGIIYQVPWHSNPQERTCPHLGIWTLMPAPEQVDKCEGIIAGAIRHAMQQHSLQGFVARWDWTPHDSSWITPYEHACFKHGEGRIGGTESDCKTFLRGIGTKLWLGADLLERVGGTVALEKLQGASYCAPYAEIALNSDAEIDAAEAALEAILPGTAALPKV